MLQAAVLECGCRTFSVCRMIGRPEREDTWQQMQLYVYRDVSCLLLMASYLRSVLGVALGIAAEWLPPGGGWRRSPP